ncbi:intraflagellar transport protein 74 homolog [Selaginella moellendorffii]|uniref:intraflagellar transport protein 74 homolog n=1 Tax=Selaginella moellendorffii TaxID=88036 RepID=UPI000D1CE6E9|nr:intraflagellar transport protein 74 homolog [Selaginella moellendorffii]|eukprot:XP_024545065.1 intraflagellar transport protein 74 homolog [Selaginella moellendorffii]
MRPRIHRLWAPLVYRPAAMPGPPPPTALCARLRPGASSRGAPPHQVCLHVLGSFTPCFRPGSPSINTDVKALGPGRQILDRSYYVGKLRSKKQELQQEIERMVEEVEQLEKERFASVHVGQKQKALAEEVQGLKLQLLDYTVVMEKVSANRRLHVVCNLLKQAPEAKVQYVELQQEYRKLETEVERLQSLIGEIGTSNEELEQIRQDNLEIIKAEEKSQVLESEIHFHEGKIAEAERSISELKELEFHRGELKQLDDLEARTETDISCTKQAISLLENEMEDFKRLDGSRSQCDAKCAKLEAEKQKIEEKKAFLQEQVREQVEKLEAFSQILDDSDLHRNLEDLKTRFHALQSSNQVLQEEVETKERELNYGLVLENIRFMVSQLNSEIKNSQMQSY